MADFGLPAFALFFMRSASFPPFQRALEKGQGRSNRQSLFGIEKIPSGNYIRDMLDGANPALLSPCFGRVETLLAEPPMRQAFGGLGGKTLVAWDGTEYFRSRKIGCPHCLTRKRSSGKLESYRSMLAATVVAPGHSKAVPLMPEFIAPRDGADKQDCERNAVKRWFGKHRARLAPLRPVYPGDGLFACLPVAKGSAAEIAARGRARWKSQNESFTAMKNHGYELEHNPRLRGDKLWPWRDISGDDAGGFEPARLRLSHRARSAGAAREAAGKRTAFFAHLYSLTAYALVPLLAGLPRIPHDLHNPARTPQNPKKRTTGVRGLLLELLLKRTSCLPAPAVMIAMVSVLFDEVPRYIRPKGAPETRSTECHRKNRTSKSLRLCSAIRSRIGSSWPRP